MNDLLTIKTHLHRGEIAALVVVEQMIVSAVTAYVTEAKDAPTDSPVWERLARASDVHYAITGMIEETRELRCDIAMRGEIEDAKS